MSIKQRIRRWLDIQDPLPTRDWSAEFDRFKKENWKLEQVLKARVAGKCGGCGKKLMLWPYATEAYYTHDGKAFHVKCYQRVIDGLKDE